MDHRRFDTLTPAERDILRLLATGLRPGEIAATLGRSVNTVHNHLKAARQKLGTGDSLTAARALQAFDTTDQSVTSDASAIGFSRPLNEMEASAPFASEPRHDVLREEHSAFGDFPRHRGQRRNGLPGLVRLTIMVGLLLMIGMVLLLALPLVRSAQEVGRYINSP